MAVNWAAFPVANRTAIVSFRVRVTARSIAATIPVAAAVPTPIGTDITAVKPVTNSVPPISGSIPYLGTAELGCQILPPKSSANGMSTKAVEPFLEDEY